MPLKHFEKIIFLCGGKFDSYKKVSHPKYKNLASKLFWFWRRFFNHLLATLVNGP